MNANLWIPSIKTMKVSRFHPEKPTTRHDMVLLFMIIYLVKNIKVSSSDPITFTIFGF